MGRIRAPTRLGGVALLRHEALFRFRCQSQTDMRLNFSLSVFGGWGSYVGIRLEKGTSGWARNSPLNDSR